MEQKKPLILETGVPSIDSYNDLLKSPLFNDMETYSNLFLNLNVDCLGNYRNKWVADPFHSWSRQWEYPYVYQMIQKYIDNSRNANEFKILDVGSGVTFFPYYIYLTFEKVTVDCCDFDTEYIPIFSRINANLNQNVKFHNMDMKKLELEDNSYDIIYCISVLEHTNDHENVLKEFHRVLKPNGSLILTFDISIDGFADISIDAAKELISLIEKYYTPLESMDPYDPLDRLTNSNQFLTTGYIKEINKSLLPWSYSISTLSQVVKNCFNYSMILKIVNRIKHPNPNLTIYCNQYKK
jgi:ubiquinone/menaquinone biosynthesis C-methylase UbiE